MSHPIPPVKPHGDLEDLFPGVWSVTGSMSIGPTTFSRNMQILKQGDELVLVNTVRLDEARLEALDALGKVTHTIRLSGFHGSDDRFYQQRYGCTVWAVKGHTYFTGVNPAKGTIYFEPDRYLEAGGELPVAGASLHVVNTDPPEGLLRIEAGGGTLISGDALQNWGTTDDYFNWLGGAFMKVVGFLKPHNLGPGWVKGCKPSPTEVAGILELGFENVLPSHGSPVIGGAVEKYRPVIEAYVARS